MCTPARGELPAPPTSQPVASFSRPGVGEGAPGGEPPSSRRPAPEQTSPLTSPQCPDYWLSSGRAWAQCLHWFLIVTVCPSHVNTTMVSWRKNRKISFLFKQGPKWEGKAEPSGRWEGGSARGPVRFCALPGGSARRRGAQPAGGPRVGEPQPPPTRCHPRPLGTSARSCPPGGHSGRWRRFSSRGEPRRKAQVY